MPDDLQPSRPWDELISTSVARGRVLRRRRRVAQASMPLVAASTLTAVLLWPPSIAGRDSLTVVPALPGPSQQEPPSGHARPNVSGGAASAPRSGAAKQPGAPGADQPVPRPGVHYSRPSDVFAPSLSFTDARGDAVPAVGGAPVGSPASDPSMDILSVRVESHGSGLSLTLRLAAAHRDDAFYRVELTDAVSGCTLMATLGGSEPDGFVDSCGGGRLVVVPEHVDPSLDVLTALIPWSYLPRDLSPHDAYGVPDARVSQGVGGQAATVDVATGPRAFGRLR